MGIAVERNLDMMFGEKDLEDVCAFKQFPIYMGVTMQPPKDDIFEDMRWTISKGSGMVQLRKIIPDEILYKYSHNSGYGKVWSEHYKAFSEFIYKNSGGGGS